MKNYFKRKLLTLFDWTVAVVYKIVKRILLSMLLVFGLFIFFYVVYPKQLSQVVEAIYFNLPFVTSFVSESQMSSIEIRIDESYTTNSQMLCMDSILDGYHFNTILEISPKNQAFSFNNLMPDQERQLLFAPVIARKSMRVLDFKQDALRSIQL